jgi:hypothetical protein
MVLLACGVLPPPAVGQTRGLPEHFRDVLQGVGAGLDVGFDSTFGFRTVALTGTAALGHLTDSSAERGKVTIRLFNVSATLGRFQSHGASPGGWSIGGAVNLSAQLQAGVDYSRSGPTGRVHLIPISGIPGEIDCLSAKLNVHVWVGLGWDFEHVSDGAGGRWERSWTSLSGGLGLQLRNGLGLEVAVGGPNTGVPSDPYRQPTVDIGLHFSRHNIVTLSSPHDRGCHVTSLL